MSLNIKNEHVHDLAREAARRAGTSLTSVIETALEAYLARLDEAEQKPSRRRMRVDEILHEVDAVVTDDDRRRMRGLMEEMYDEKGLPAW